MPAVLLSLMFVSTNITTPLNYPLAQASRANGGVVILGPYVALAAAWEMGAIKAIWGRLPVTRHAVAVTLSRLRLVIVAGLGAFLALYVTNLGTALFDAFPGWSFALLSLASVIAWTAMGAALALCLPLIVALPVSAIGPFLLLSLPQGWSPLWLRHLNGYLSDCCLTSETVDPRAVAGSLAFLTLIAAVSLVACAVRMSKSFTAALRSLGVGAVAISALFAVALPTLSDVTKMGAMPSIKRNAGELRCVGDVCLWPEDAAGLKANAQAWTQVSQAWTKLGLPLSKERIAPITTEDNIGIATQYTNADGAKRSMAALLPREISGCRDNFDDPQRNLALDGLKELLLASLSPNGPLTDSANGTGTGSPKSRAAELWRASGGCP